MSRRTLALVVVVACLAVAAVDWVWTRGPRSAPAVSGAVRGANLVVISIDTLRADRVGHGLTPAIDAVAARGLSFTNARTPAPLTLPAHVSLMTGLFPPDHGVRENGTFHFDQSHPTLARLLGEAGYRTAAFIAAYVLDRRFGLNDGFELYDDQIRRDPAAVGRLDAERRGDIVADSAIAWLNNRAGGPATSRPPFFVWLHLYDPHAPYTPPPPFAEKAHGQPYDGEVAFADAQVGRVLDTLAHLGEASRTFVVIVGDHGESLGDHGERTHGMLLFDAALRVPLVLAGPGVPRGTRDGSVSLVDVVPTILRLLSRPVPPGLSGSDLLAARNQPATDVYSETEYPRAAGWSPVYSLVEDRWKLIEAASLARLFDLRQDPGEQQDVGREHEAVVRSMRARLDQIRSSARGSSAGRERPVPEVAERLRSLGYIAAATEPEAGPSGPDPSTVIDAWTRFDAATDRVNERDYGRALPLLGDLVDQHPESAVFALTLTQALQAAGDGRGALAVGRRAVVRHPRDATLLHALAAAARDARELDEARRAEEAAMLLAPRDPGPPNGLGLIYVDLARPADAALAFEKAVALDPTNAQYWNNLGNARRETGARTAAADAYRQALAVDPQSADAANGLGVLLVQDGRPAEAIRWFEQALANAPAFYEARLNLGIACQEVGQYALAAEAYRAVATAPPRFQREREAARKLLSSLPKQ